MDENMESFRAMRADVIHTGTDAFLITRRRPKPDEEVSNREDPLQVSGDIVNTRPSGTKPR
jgi:hypothetical protein